MKKKAVLVKDFHNENGTLHVKGNISIYKNKWFDTKDIVELNKNKEFYIQGRSL